MPAPVYSQRFLATPSQTGWEGFTVPSGYTCVIRSAGVYIGAPGTSAQLDLSWNPSGSTLVVIKTWQPSTTAVAFTDTWDGRFVLYEGEQVFFIARNGTWDCWCAGYILQGLPPEIVLPAQSSPPQSII